MYNEEKRMIFYILDENHEPVPATLLEGAAFFESLEKRRVAYHESGKKRASTVFLGMDHNFFEDGPPILFETMTWPDEEQERYSTYTEALAGHERHCKRMGIPMHQEELT